MKKITLLTFLFLIGTRITNAQNIPNSSFENWVSYDMGEKPISWNTSDSLTAHNGLGHSAVKESSDFCDLIYSIKMTSIGFGTITGPGVATNGVITGNVSSYSASGGSPDTARSRFISGCVKYIPAGAGTDKGVISAFLFRWNAATSTRDTIAYSIDSITTALALTSFSYPFIYRDWVNQPDTALIILQSSPALFNASIGSSMTVDNLALSGWVGINEANSVVKVVKLFSLPVSNELNVHVELTSAISMKYEVMDVTGKLMITDKMKSETEKIDVSKLATGNYFITLRDEQGKKLYSDKFTIVR